MKLNFKEMFKRYKRKNSAIFLINRRAGVDTCRHVWNGPITWMNGSSWEKMKICYRTRGPANGAPIDPSPGRRLLWRRPVRKQKK